MSGHMHYIAGDLPYYVIDCDQCAAPLSRYDDSCYDWQTLRAQAIEIGWKVGEALTDPVACPLCVRPTANLRRRIRGCGGVSSSGAPDLSAI